MLLARRGLVDEPALLNDVGQSVDHPGIRGQAVATGAARLLVIRLDALRHVEVRDEAHVRLVDAHAEGDGGHHHDGIVADEAAEMFAAGLVLLVRVVRQRVDARVHQERGGLVHGLAREAVDDARVAGVFLANELQQLFARVVTLGDAVANVRAIEARDEDARGIELQLRDDFFPRGGVRGRGERDARDPG